MLNCDYYNNGFRLRLNRGNTSYGQRVSTNEVDQYINEAGKLWYKTQTSKAEKDTSIRTSLRPFETKNKPLNVTCEGVYFKADIPKDCYYPLGYMVYASKEGCPDCPKLMTPYMVQTDDLIECLKDPNRQPSFEYGDVLIDDAKDFLYIYTDGTFNIDKVDLSYYIKLPTHSCAKLAEDGYYVDSAGSKISTNSTFPIENEYDADEIIDIASLFFFRDRGDNISLDTQLTKINTKYRIIAMP